MAALLPRSLVLRRRADESAAEGPAASSTVELERKEHAWLLARQPAHLGWIGLSLGDAAIRLPLPLRGPEVLRRLRAAGVRAWPAGRPGDVLLDCGPQAAPLLARFPNYFQGEAARGPLRGCIASLAPAYEHLALGPLETLFQDRIAVPSLASLRAAGVRHNGPTGPETGPVAALIDAVKKALKRALLPEEVAPETFFAAARQISSCYCHWSGEAVWRPRAGAAPDRHRGRRRAPEDRCDVGASWMAVARAPAKMRKMSELAHSTAVAGETLCAPGRATPVIGVPLGIAMKLRRPHAAPTDELLLLLANGPERYPGASGLLMDGALLHLRTEERRTSVIVWGCLDKSHTT
jgi:hypothetical protein